MLNEISRDSRITEEEFLLRLPLLFREIYKKANFNANKQDYLYLNGGLANYEAWTSSFVTWSRQKPPVEFPKFDWCRFNSFGYILVLENSDFNIKCEILLEYWYKRSKPYRDMVDNIKKQYGITFVEEDFKISVK